ncbi:unnamed protein product [Fraxinus pennsylvanica]|uniref:Uncharacterized protein n=1 Tax=Fraxinus pennsylvanica TaxID=56036 RepID=A0AAD1ZRF1_9LAMI|nr:unnamed protein product [Fraxinus pennsylvanica]
MPQGGCRNDLEGLVFDNQTPDLPKIPGEFILENIFQINLRRSKWVNLGVIFGMMIIYRLIFLMMIKINEDVAPSVHGCIARRRIQRRKRNQNTSVGVIQSPSPGPM